MLSLGIRDLTHLSMQLEKIRVDVDMLQDEKKEYALYRIDFLQTHLDKQLYGGIKNVREEVK